MSKFLPLLPWRCRAGGICLNIDICSHLGQNGTLRLHWTGKTAREVRETCTFLDSEVGHYWDILRTQMSLSAYSSVAESLS